MKPNSIILYPGSAFLIEKAAIKSFSTAPFVEGQRLIETDYGYIDVLKANRINSITGRYWRIFGYFTSKED